MVHVLCRKIPANGNPSAQLLRTRWKYWVRWWIFNCNNVDACWIGDSSLVLKRVDVSIINLNVRAERSSVWNGQTTDYRQISKSTTAPDVLFERDLMTKRWRVKCEYLSGNSLPPREIRTHSSIPEMWKSSSEFPTSSPNKSSGKTKIARPYYARWSCGNKSTGCISRTIAS